MMNEPAREAAEQIASSLEQCGWAADGGIPPHIREAMADCIGQVLDTHARDTNPVVSHETGNVSDDLCERVRVRPLEWEETNGNYEGQIVWSPKDDIWPCWIVKNPDRASYVWCEEIGIELAPASPVRGTFATLEEAKAAAQADYERRILSALEPATTTAPQAAPDDEVAVSPSDPMNIIAGIKQFGLAPDGADLRDLEAAVERLAAERDAALDRVDDLETDAERVSAEFEGELWKSVRRLLDECNFDWRDVDHSGVTADDAETHILETLQDAERRYEREKAHAERAEASAQRLKAALEPLRKAVEFTAKWCWRHGPDTDSERLSVIKYHPTIRAALEGKEPRDDQ